MRTTASVLALCLCLVTPSASFAKLTTTNVNGVELIIESSATPAPTSSKPRSRHQPAAGAAVAQAASLEASVLPGADGLIRTAYRFVGTPYVWGGASPSGFDCSGYVWYVYRQMGISIPRTADVQFAAGRPIAGDPSPGDLVFFQTYDYGASHVGLYLGNGQFLNALGAKVHIDNFGTEYFRSRYLGARRFLPG